MGQQRPIDIQAQTRKREVDNRLSLKIYYRTAENLLKQANIYRHERNVVDLYVFLLRFSSLVSETIPEHRDYETCCQEERKFYRSKLKSVIDELEALKDEAHRQVEKINRELRAPSRDVSALDHAFGSVSISRELGFSTTASARSVSIPRPKDETLARHSLLGAMNQRRGWDVQNYQLKPVQVQYPSRVDTSMIEIPSLDANWRTPPVPSAAPVGTSAVSTSLTSGDAWIEELMPKSAADSTPFTGTGSVWSPTLIRQPSPPPVAAHVQTLPPPCNDHNSAFARPRFPEVADPWPGPAALDEGPGERGPKRLFISVNMMNEFLLMAQRNTQMNLETCGVLGGSLKHGTFNVTALIIPKQKSTSDSCEAMNEEEIFDTQDKRGLFQLGWIHTHPSQSCFMSSIDLHTHYSYQIMLPEAIAIVMAPKDSERQHGIFRLADPAGVKVIQQCQERGFHPHERPDGGGAIYEHCSHVYMKQEMNYEIIDLR